MAKDLGILVPGCLQCYELLYNVKVELGDAIPKINVHSQK